MNMPRVSHVQSHLFGLNELNELAKVAHMPLGSTRNTCEELKNQPVTYW